jgi:hypothetical protein
VIQPDITSIAHIIQLAVAPVFLLAGVGSLLGVLSNRLGRITDRARVLETRRPHISDEEKKEQVRKELKTLWKRIRLTNWAVSLCTTSALLICLVIVALFIGDFVLLEVNLPAVVGILFISTMSILILALICFLREIFLATKTMKLGMFVLLDDE